MMLSDENSVHTHDNGDDAQRSDEMVATRVKIDLFLRFSELVPQIFWIQTVDIQPDSKNKWDVISNGLTDNTRHRRIQ